MSDDLTTLDLYSIHYDRDRLATLHTLQEQRCEERAITAGDRPAGMRLSIADPVRRVKAALDPFWALSIDEGVGMRGHLLEDYLEVALFHGRDARYYDSPYVSQEPIQWHEHGRSAFDFVIPDTRVVSCKSSIKGGKPSAANIDQERRMMALAGWAAGSPFEVWVLNPSTFRAVGPYEYTLNQEHIDAAHAELAAVSKAYAYFQPLGDIEPSEAAGWNDPAFWEREFGLTSTSGAFRYDVLDASGAIEARNRAYLRARAAATQAKADEDAAKALVRVHVEEQIAAAQREGLQVKSVRAYSGDEEAVYAIDARGAMRCTVKPRSVEQVAS